MKVLFAGMTTSPIRSCPVHSHTCFEMILTLSGTGTAGAGTRRTSFEPGTVLVVPPGMPHFTDAEGYFEDIFVQLEEPRWPRDQCLVLRDYKGDMKKLITMLYENYVQREAGYGQVVESLMRCLCQYVDKYTRDRFRFPFVRELMDILTGNLGNSGLSIPTEAARLGVSFEYLRHCFKQDTGTTPLAYLTMMRIEQAKELLWHREFCTVEEIAAQCGFSDPYYFSRSFKKAVGMSPRAYRSLRENDAARGDVRKKKDADFD